MTILKFFKTTSIRRERKFFRSTMKVFRLSFFMTFISAGLANGQVTQWEGFTSDWRIPANWNAGIPTESTDVIISVGSATGRTDPITPAPIGSDTARVKNLTVQSGGILTFSPNPFPGILVVFGRDKLQNDGTILLGDGQIFFKYSITFYQGGTFDAGSGTLAFNGVTWDNKPGSTFIPGTSTVIFDGDSNQILNGDISFFNVIVSTGDTLTINGNVTVLNNAIIDSGATLNLSGTSTFTVYGTFTNYGTITGTGTLNVPISHYTVDALSPQVAGTIFSVTVVARDASGDTVSGNNSTVVTLSSNTGNVQFDGSGNGVFGEAGDNLKTLSSGTFTIDGKSNTAETVTITATDTGGKTGNTSVIVVAGTPSAVALTSGDNQSGIVGTALSNPFVITVTDTFGNPVQATSVTFGINSFPPGAAGQSLSVIDTTTDANGQASSLFTLGNRGGMYTVTASAAGLTGNPVTFTANASAGSAAAIALTSGDGQSGTVGTSVANPFVVTVTDAFGNAVQGTSISFLIASTPFGASGHMLSVYDTTTNAAGEASTFLTLGNTSGTYTVTAASLGLTGSPVAFTANASAGSAAAIALTSGDGQSGTVGTSVTNPFVVTVTDAFGNPVQGTSVSFLIASTPPGASGQALSVYDTTTNAAGEASTVLTLGNTSGTYTVTATSLGLTGSPITFSSNASAGSAAAIALTSGDNQSGTVGTTLTNPFVVTVSDAFGNPVQGTSVSFLIASTPPGASGQALSVYDTTTNAAGEASSLLTLGNIAGTYTVTTTSLGLTGSPVTFSSNASAGSAAAIALTSGDNQSGTVGTTLTNPFVVTVTDAFGNPVEGTNVDFAIDAVPPGAVGQSISATNTNTNPAGEASTVLTLGNRPGAYTVSATSVGLTGSPVTFAANASVGQALTIVLTSGDGQVGIVGTTLSNPFVVMVTDTFGNPVQGTSVSFLIAFTPPGASGQALSVYDTTTNDSGMASTVLTLGDSVGPYMVMATSIGLNGSPIIFTATAEPMVGVAMEKEIPKEFRLYQNYPNPFNPFTKIHFSLAEQNATSLRLYNVIGQEIATLFSGIAEPGRLYTIDVDASNLNSGVYFYRLQAGTFVDVKKMLLLK